ncbi:MAG: GtrA family protein [Candidatus Nealsonbacteria bacterium]
MKKSDILAPVIIGFVIAVIFLGVLKFSPEYLPELPDTITKSAVYLLIIFPVLSVLGVFIAQFLSRKFEALFQLAKFILVGALNTFVDLGIMIILLTIFGISAGILYSTTKAFSFVCSVINSYFWNKFWTFGQKETGVEAKEFGKFFLIAGTGFLINVGIASLVVNFIGPQFGLSKEKWALAGAFIAIICVFMWNFLGYKFVVFKK